MAQPGWRHAVGTHDELAGLAVLSRERGHGRSVPCLRRPAGQQFLGGGLLLSKRRNELELGEHVRRGWLLDVGGPVRSDVYLRGGAGRGNGPGESIYPRDTLD